MLREGGFVDADAVSCMPSVGKTPSSEAEGGDGGNEGGGVDSAAAVTATTALFWFWGIFLGQ